MHEILGRNATKKYDAKAIANGRPTLLKLAVGEAERWSLDEVNKEAAAEMASFGTSPGHMAQGIKLGIERLIKRS